MWTFRDFIVFLAGAAAFHTLSHIVLGWSGLLPMTFWGIHVTQQYNMVIIVMSAIITAALLWYASKLSR